MTKRIMYVVVYIALVVTTTMVAVFLIPNDDAGTQCLQDKETVFALKKL